MTSQPSLLAKAGTALLAGGYGSFTVAIVMGLLALRSTGAEFEKRNRRWIRLGFLLLACALVLRAFGAQAGVGDADAWGRTETWGLVLWLGCGAVLHLHYEPALKGRKAVWGSLLLGGLLLLTLFGMGIIPTRN